jgi:hypothetical protein
MKEYGMITAKRMSGDVGRIAWILVCVAMLAGWAAKAQITQPKAPESAVAVATPASVDRAAAGDAPDDPGPLATDLSPGNHPCRPQQGCAQSDRLGAHANKRNIQSAVDVCGFV